MKIDRKSIFVLFIGFIMVTSTMGYALLYSYNESNQQQVKIEDVYNRELTVSEKVMILRYGRTIIEYLHNGTPENLEKQAVYENFAARFKGFVVLVTAEVSQSNLTIDQMINPMGDMIPLSNVTSDQLIDIFCDTSLLQPRECLLRGI